MSVQRRHKFDGVASRLTRFNLVLNSSNEQGLRKCFTVQQRSILAVLYAYEADTHQRNTITVGPTWFSEHDSRPIAMLF